MRPELLKNMYSVLQKNVTKVCKGCSQGSRPEFQSGSRPE